ncbi:MAG: DUF3027 domain-containing protein [Actinobacteria bacterium]|nr:DUF3027 domain-containing protein [Actinomycetota bacterium]
MPDIEPDADEQGPVAASAAALSALDEGATGADIAAAVEAPFTVDEPVATLPEPSLTAAAVNARLLDARDLALAALHEITPAATVGPPAGYLPEADGVISLRFENRLGGYPGWYWTVSVAQVDDAEPTVLEAELLPGDGALLAPDWVPWAERLAEYRAHQAELAAAGQAEGGSDAASEDEGSDDEGDLVAEDLEDLEDLDEDDLDTEDLEDDEEEGDSGPRLHAGDLDGVDIDELDDSTPDEDSDDEDSDDEDSDDEDDADDSEEE